MPEQFPMSDLFESGECTGCGVLLDDAGIVMVEPSDPWVRLVCGPWAQESCGECTLPLSHWRLAAHPTPEELAWWRDEIAGLHKEPPEEPEPVSDRIALAGARQSLTCQEPGSATCSMFDPPCSRYRPMRNAGKHRPVRCQRPFSFMSRCMGLCFRALRKSGIILCICDQRHVE